MNTDGTQIFQELKEVGAMAQAVQACHAVAKRRRVNRPYLRFSTTVCGADLLN